MSMGRKRSLQLLVMQNGGQPGQVAINPAMVTHVRSASGPFTDIHFGEHKVTVAGTFEQVVARLTGEPEPTLAKAEIRNMLPLR
jgi:hypothetical protein